MKKLLLILLFSVIVLFLSCQKRKCKEQQAAELQKQLEIFQKEVSNPNLTTRQKINFLKDKIIINKNINEAFRQKIL